MDKWFVELFDIIRSQKKTGKMDLLLPELYSEFDILARNDNIDELTKVYHYINKNNPFQTIDKVYNNNANIILKKEVIKRFVILNNYEILDDEFNDILETNNKKKIKDYLEMWDDNIIVSMHLKDIQEQFVPTVSVKQKKTEDIVEDPDLNSDPDIDEFPDMSKRYDSYVEPVEEEKIEVEEIKQDESPVLEEPIIEEKAVKPEVLTEEEPPVKVKEKITPEDVIPVKKKVVRKTKEKTIVKEVKKETIPEEVIETKKIPEKTEKERLLGFVDMAIYKYKISINREVIKNQNNPSRLIQRFMKDFVDEKERNTDFFVELFQLLSEYNLDNLISYLAEKSDMLKKICNLNIGLLNESDTVNKYSILDSLKNENIAYIKESIAERDVRTYIDKNKQSNENLESLINFSKLSANNAPWQMETHEATKAIDYFKNNIVYNKTNILDNNNVDVLYWSMILSAVIGIYVIRKNPSDYIDSINFVSKIAIKLINKIDKYKIKTDVQYLAISYVRRIFKCGTTSPNYENAWQKQKDDLLDAKLNALNILRPLE